MAAVLERLDLTAPACWVECTCAAPVVREIGVSNIPVRVTVS